MMIVLRNVIAVIIGLFIGGCVNMALVQLGPHVIAVPAGVDVTRADSLIAGAHLLQPANFLFPFLAHALGTLSGALLTFVIAASHRAILVYGVGTVWLAGGIAACFMIPAPLWFIVLDLVLAYLPMAWLAIRIGRRFIPAAPVVAA